LYFLERIYLPSYPYKIIQKTKSTIMKGMLSFTSTSCLMLTNINNHYECFLTGGSKIALPSS